MDDFDIYKSALGNWSARNKFLIDKWTKTLETIESELDSLYTLNPSSARTSAVWEKQTVIGYIIDFINDLKAPALSDLDFKTVNSFVSESKKKCVDAIQLDLLDGDYVRKSF